MWLDGLLAVGIAFEFYYPNRAAGRVCYVCTRKIEKFPRSEFRTAGLGRLVHPNAKGVVLFYNSI